MILSQKKIEEIAVAVTKDFNEFFFGSETKDIRRMARGTPIDQFAKEIPWLGSVVCPSFPGWKHLWSDRLCGYRVYHGRDGREANHPTQEKKSNSVGCQFYSAGTSPKALRQETLLPLPMSAHIRFCSRWKVKLRSQPMQRNTQPVQPILSGT